MIPKSLARRVGAVLLVAAAAGCSGGGGENLIAQEDLEQEVATQLAAAVDQPEPNISCPGDLEAEVGATTECELSVDGDDAVYPVTVEVTSAEDGDAEFEIEVGETPKE